MKKILLTVAMTIVLSVNLWANAVDSTQSSTPSPSPDSTLTMTDTTQAQLDSSQKRIEPLSFETAHSVKSVDEEYKYIRQNYHGARISGQALMTHNGKHYDMIKIVYKGKTISLYFKLDFNLFDIDDDDYDYDDDDDDDDD